VQCARCLHPVRLTPRALPACLTSSPPHSQIGCTLCSVKRTLLQNIGCTLDARCPREHERGATHSKWTTAQGQAGAPASASAASTPTTMPAIAPAGKPPPPPPPPPPLPPSGRTGIVDSGADELRASAVVSGAGAGAASAPAGAGDGAAGGCPVVRLSMLAPAHEQRTASSGPRNGMQSKSNKAAANQSQYPEAWRISGLPIGRSCLDA